MTEKYCMDCKHYLPNIKFPAPQWAKCAVGRKKVDPVSGKSTEEYPSFCKHNRELGWLRTRILGACGKEGRLWESK